MSAAPKPRLLVTRLLPPLTQKKLVSFKDKFNIIQFESGIGREDLIKQAPGCEALYCLITDKIDKDVIDAAGPSLRIVSTMSVGMDHIDLDYCKLKGIKVANTPDVLTDATADLTLALLLATLRRIPEAIRTVQQGRWGNWSPTWICGTSLAQKTVGIVGLGRIGSAVVDRLVPFKVGKVLYCGNSPKGTKWSIETHYTSFEEVLRNSDIVIVTCALTDATQGMFNEEAFRKMKPTSTLINVSRGSIVNQDALCHALREGLIASAGNVIFI
jgi:glyoxylate/hydroxypyruvate reductase